MNGKHDEKTLISPTFIRLLFVTRDIKKNFFFLI